MKFFKFYENNDTQNYFSDFVYNTGVAYKLQYGSFSGL